jgi:hypothetical protein
MHLVFDPHALDDLEQSLSKTYTDVHIVDVREANQRTAEFSLCWCRHRDPVCCVSKIFIGVAGLPPVACQADEALDSRTLQMKNM